MEPELPATTAANAVPSSAPPDPDFDTVFAALAVLSRNHLLYFRAEAGKFLAEKFFGNDRRAYHDRSNQKESALARFAREKADGLKDLGLSEQILRQCILAWWVVEDLPKSVVEKLRFTHVVHLSTVEDAATRELLAKATLDNKWSGDALKDAVLAVRAGKWIDGDLEQPGLQPPAPEPPKAEDGKLPQAGRVVSRFERTVTDLEDLAGQWDRVPVEKLTALQRERTTESLAKIKAHVARLEARLAGS
jgi:hypothetical protein